MPEWWKDHCKIEHTAKGRSKDWAMPVEMQKAFDRLMGEYSVGSSRVTPNGTNVTCAHIVTTLKSLLPMFADKWEEAAEQRWERVLELHDEMTDGRKEPKVVLEEARKLPKVHKCRVKPNKTWARRFMHRFGIDTWACNTAGTYLDSMHPSMTSYRSKWKSQQEVAKVPLALRINYDQMWKNRYRAPKRKTRKCRDQISSARPDRKIDPRSMPQKRSLKRKLQDSQLLEASDGQTPAKRHKSMDEDARFDMIQYYRMVARGNKNSSPQLSGRYTPI